MSYKFPRLRLGTKVPSAKLSESDVRDIRRIYAAKQMTQQQLADKFIISRSIISGIVQRTQWSHVKDQNEEEKRPQGVL